MDKEAIATLYVVENDVNDKLYHGIFWAKDKTAEMRFREHMYAEGKCKPGSLLHKAAKEIGPEHFKIRVLCVGSLSYIRELEETMTRQYSLYPKGYNGNAGFSIVHTPDTIAKITAALRKREVSTETREKIRAAHFGRKHSDEFCQKQRDRVISAETRFKISQINRGRVQSDATKKKRSDSIKRWMEDNPEKAARGLESAHAWLRSDEGRKELSERILGEKNPMFGRTHSDEAKQKMSEKRKGVPKSEETKRKISEGHRRRRLLREQQQLEQQLELT